MQFFVQATSVHSKKEDWLDISTEKGESGPEVKLNLKKNSNPVVKSSFLFTKGSFGKIPLPKGKEADGAKLSATLFVEVIVYSEVGALSKAVGKAPKQMPAASLEVVFDILLIGSRLEIENARMAWDGSPQSRTLPKKDLEAVYSMCVSSSLPDSLKRQADTQALLLLELFKGSSISLS
jgi:hypothetical protein